MDEILRRVPRTGWFQISYVYLPFTVDTWHESHVNWKSFEGDILRQMQDQRGLQPFRDPAFRSGR